MKRHSNFFQGNDVEVGILAERLGYRVQYVEFPVFTDVPDTLGPWWRQRFAWTGGEWRICIMNARWALYHFAFYLYSIVIVYVLLPFRWYSVFLVPAVLLIVYGIYVILVSVLNFKCWHWIIILYPLYAFFYSFLMIALAPLSYVLMSTKHHNWGIISTRIRR